jgi:cell division septation protein DedD
MKASPNREQQLFLITGGVILLLILAVVIFNMVRSPSITVEEEVTKRPMVKLTDKLGRTGSYAQSSPIGTAPVFGNHLGDKELNFESVKARAVVKPGEKAPPTELENPERVLGGQTPDERLVGGWNRSPADLEAGRHEVARKLAEEKKKKQPAPVKSVEVVAKKVPPTAKPKEKPSAVKPIIKRTEPVADFSKAIANVVSKQKMARLAQEKARKAAEVPVKAKPIRQAVAVTSKPPVRVKVQAPVKAVGSSSGVTAKNGYSIQIASLSSMERAQTLQGKLRSYMFDGKRMPVYQGVATVKSKTYYRVRLGPFSTRTKAERAERLIQSKIGMEGRLIKPSSR